MTADTVPILFSKGPEGTPIGDHEGRRVYPEQVNGRTVGDGDTWFVSLRPDGDCYRAVPIRQVDADFLLDLSVEDRMGFLRSVFIKGDRVSEDLVKVLTESAPEIVQRLDMGSRVLDRNSELSELANMYRVKLDNANAAIRQRDSEIAKLRERINTPSDRGDHGRAKKELSEARGRIAELETLLRESEGKVSELSARLEESESGSCEGEAAEEDAE